MILLYYQMEYQQKKEQILSSVQFTSLLSFNLVENKLERNFRAIVEALLLNQGRTDEVATRTDQLDDRITLERQKGAQEQEAIRQALKHINQRVTKLENSSTLPKMPKSESSKAIKEPQKTQITRKDPFPSDYSPSSDKNSFLEKKLEDVFQQIGALKDKMPTLKLVEAQLENMKRDLTMMRGELMAVGKSSKSIKRESINPTKPVFRRESSSKIGKGNTLSHSNSSVLLQDKQNKENKSQHIDGREAKEANEANRLETNASNVISGDNELEREIEGLHIQVNTLNLCFQELKGQVEDLRKKDIRYHSTLAELEDRQRKMQDEMRRDSESFEKNLKSIQFELINAGSRSPPEKIKEEPEQFQKQSKKVGSGSIPAANPPSSSEKSERSQESSVNFKNQINDRINKLQNSLLGFVSESEFNRFKGETRGKLEEVEKKHDKLVNQYEEEIRKIYDMFINKDVEAARLGELIASTSESIKENHSQAERKHNIAIARIEQLKKNLQNLREDVEFYQAMNTENKESKKSQESKKGEEAKGEDGKREGLVESRALEDLKKYFNNKLHDQRAYLVGLVRDLQKKQNSASGVGQQIANLWDKINELNVFLGKKGDAEDIKKNLIYLEKKLNKIGAQLVKADDNTEDARIARTNWFCLSCDKGLMGYQGKLGKHIAWDSMPLKGTVKPDKKGLPSLKK